MVCVDEVVDEVEVVFVGIVNFVIFFNVEVSVMGSCEFE